MLWSKGDLIRCTRDGDIGVILSVDFELETFAVFWNSDGYSPEEEGDVNKWSCHELFVILNHGRKANDI